MSLLAHYSCGWTIWLSGTSGLCCTKASWVVPQFSFPGLTQLAWLSPPHTSPQGLAIGWPGSGCLAESLLLGTSLQGTGAFLGISETGVENSSQEGCSGALLGAGYVICVAQKSH